MKIQDRLRNETGGWDNISLSNACYFAVENGILRSVKLNAKKNLQNSHYDLRAHCANYTSKGSHDIPSRKCVFWFWNSEFSPAPGFAIVSYLGAAYSSRPHGNAKKTVSPYERASHTIIAGYGHRHQETTLNVDKDEMLKADLDNTTPLHNKQQVASAQHRKRKMYGIAGSLKASNLTTVCLPNVFVIDIKYVVFVILDCEILKIY